MKRFTCMGSLLVPYNEDEDSVEISGENVEFSEM